MHSIISQFLSELRNTTWFEFIAVVTGIASVIFSRKENILVYPVGMISTGMFVPLYILHGLYADASVNLYYTVMSIIGWYMWSRKSEGRTKLHITASSKKDWLNGILFFLVCWTIFVFASQSFYRQHGPRGRQFYFRRRFYRHVADEQKKTRKLDLVDHHGSGFRPPKFLQTSCFYQFSIRGISDPSCNGLYYLAKKNPTCRRLKKL